VLFQNHAEATDLATHLGLAPPVKLSLPKFRSIPSESEFKLVQQARNELNAWTKNNEKVSVGRCTAAALRPRAERWSGCGGGRPGGREGEREGGRRFL